MFFFKKKSGNTNETQTCFSTRQAAHSQYSSPLRSMRARGARCKHSVHLAGALARRPALDTPDGRVAAVAPAEPAFGRLGMVVCGTGSLRRRSASLSSSPLSSRVDCATCGAEAAASSAGGSQLPTRGRGRGDTTLAPLSEPVRRPDSLDLTLSLESALRGDTSALAARDALSLAALHTRQNE